MGELRKKLEAEVSTVPWSRLAPHHQRDALFLVDPSLDLVDVAVAVAEDRAAEVGSWIEDERIGRATAEQVEGWEQTGAVFRFLIVRPLVLAQLASDA